MDGENGRDRGEVEWLLNDPASTMEPALIWPSLTAIASGNLSLITLSTNGPRPAFMSGRTETWISLLRRAI